MRRPLLRYLTGLRTMVIHPNDQAGKEFSDHLNRIGCLVTSIWPVPNELPHDVEVVFLTIEDEQRPAIHRFLKSLPASRPTLIAVVSYENPATLQLVLESGALAVLGRPVQPFGLLASLAIARSVWTDQRDNQRNLRKLQRKIAGDKMMVKAKAILMSAKGISEEEAHQHIREQAMAKRIPMEQVASSIIGAEEFLRL